MPGGGRLLCEGRARAPGRPLILLAREARVPAGPVAGVVVGLLAFAVLGPVFATFPALLDTDSSYHVAVGRLIAQEGFVDGLPWTRFSVFRDDFGDKELLFHVLIAPFTGGDDPTLGAKWLLAGLVATILGATTGLAWRWIGLPALLVPFVQLSSWDVLARWVRLRPELLSLLLLLVAVALVARRRHRLAGVVACVYSLSYTAVHVLPGLCGLVFLHRALFRGRRDWDLVAWPVVGCLVGLALHPSFPANLVVWKIQNVDFFFWKDRLDVGSEIGPPTLDGWVTGSGPWLAAALLLAVLSSRRPRRVLLGEDERDTWLLAAGVFALLWLAMGRMVVYGVPFVTLAVLVCVAERPTAPALPTAWRRATVAILFATLVVGVGRSSWTLLRLTQAEGPLRRVDDWTRFSEALPNGAKVAAEWGSTAIYVLWAPHASYLNVLDPIFMAIRHPEAYAAQRAIFEGREPDVPLVLRRELDSDWIALSLFHQPAEVIERLEDDPRLERRSSGYTMLWRVAPEGADEMVTDWTVVESWRTTAPGSRETAPRAYPLSEDAELAQLEGFVDLDRVVPRDGCVRMIHRIRGSGNGVGPWTLRATVPLALRLGSTVVRHSGDDRPIEIEIEESVPGVAVEACSSPAAFRPGFSLIRPS